MNLRFAILFVLLIDYSGATAANDPQNGDELAVERVFERLSEAWRAGDGDAWADEFVSDADFTVWFGFGMKGQEDIAQGHQFIFDRFYAQTQLVMNVHRLNQHSKAAVQMSALGKSDSLLSAEAV